MPKKHTFNLKQHQGPSSTSKPASSKDVGLVASVNEKLNELRKIEGPEAAAKKREIAELVSQKSVPPQLRGILGVPETAAPKARAGVRTRDRLRTPGPAPPKSWTALGSGRWTSTLSFRKKRKGKNVSLGDAERFKPQDVDRFARMTEVDIVAGHNGQRIASLMHYTLKTVVMQWDMLDEEDYPALAELTLRLRLQVLSYMCVHGPAISIEAFEALTQGSEKITHLDLSGLVGHSTLTLPRLTKRFRQEQPKLGQDTAYDVIDSWEDEDTSGSLLDTGLSPSRFANLTHLSLSHPPPTILWRDLLAFTKQTHQITHLSLAYWPRPTLTPNLSTATVTSRHSIDVLAGGSNIYSALDQDLNEPAALLRQLSLNLLRLQWLALEGCTSWAPALALLASLPELRARVGSIDDWYMSSDSTGINATSVLTDTWRNLKYINVAHGWLPTYAGLKALPTQQGISSDRQMVREIMETLPAVEAETHDQLSVEKQKASMWLEAESRMLTAMKRINNVRRMKPLPPIVMDFGWARKTR
jgi:hypothetical protein